MYKQLKNNLTIYITIMLWIIVGVLIVFLMKKQINNTSPKQVDPEQTYELNASEVESAVDFVQSIRLTATSSSVTLESSESAQDQ